MIRSTDVRSGVGEAALLAETMGAGQFVLTHGELLSVVIPHPQPDEDHSTLYIDVVVGQLVVVGLDDREIRVRWDDPYTLHPSEEVRELMPEGDLVVFDALSRGPARVDSWFAKQERLIDMIDGRSVVIERAEIVNYEWPVPGAVVDEATPSRDLMKAVEAWFVDQGFSFEGFSKSFRKRIDDNTELVGALTPQSFFVENESRRHPVSLHLGVASRDLNQMNDWFSGSQHQPWRWTMQEPAAFFSPEASWVWPAETPPDRVLAEVARAVAALDVFARDRGALSSYLWNDERGAFHTALYQRLRLTDAVLRGWNEDGEKELEAWKSRASSRNVVVGFEATMRKYLESGKLPYWMDPS